MATLIEDVRAGMLLVESDEAAQAALTQLQRTNAACDHLDSEMGKFKDAMGRYQDAVDRLRAQQTATTITPSDAALEQALEQIDNAHDHVTQTSTVLSRLLGMIGGFAAGWGIQGAIDKRM